MSRKIKAKVLVDLESSFEDNESNMSTVEYLVGQDLHDNGWAVNSVKVKEFHMKEEED